LKLLKDDTGRAVTMQNVNHEVTGGPDGPMTLQEGLERFIAALQSGTRPPGPPP
jgi:hypothetical protein